MFVFMGMCIHGYVCVHGCNFASEDGFVLVSLKKIIFVVVPDPRLWYFTAY